MTVEEKLEVVGKELHEMSMTNQELKTRNVYLRKQDGSNMKQKQKLQQDSE